MIDLTEYFPYQPFSAQRENPFFDLDFDCQIDLDLAPEPTLQLCPFDSQERKASPEVDSHSASTFAPFSVRRPSSAKKTFYEKNICKYVIRKAIRCLQLADYRAEVTNICQRHGVEVVPFVDYYLSVMQKLTGIAALKRELQKEECFSKAFYSYIGWFLEKRYFREVCQEGHMRDLQVYINYKNKVLLPGLRRLSDWNSNKPMI